jgi:hypothetical protein
VSLTASCLTRRPERLGVLHRPGSRKAVTRLAVPPRRVTVACFCVVTDARRHRRAASHPSRTQRQNGPPCARSGGSFVTRRSSPPIARGEGVAGTPASELGYASPCWLVQLSALGFPRLISWWLLMREVRHIVDSNKIANLDTLADVVDSFWRRR